jgi:small basic protein
VILGILIIILFAILGYVIGSDVVVPFAFTEYVAVAVMAFLDSLFNGISLNMQKKFNIPEFFAGFFLNAIVSIFLVYLGNKLNVNIYLAAIIVFTWRMFNNFNIIQKILIDNLRRTVKLRRNSRKKIKEEI